MLPALMEQCAYTENCALDVTRHDAPDGVSWSLSPNGVFSTKSLYQYLEKDLS
jgi:hypothetical protein